MQQNNDRFLRELLEQMSTEQLDELLHAELKKQYGDGRAMRMILTILKEREAEELPEITPQAEEAWQEYLDHTADLPKKAPRKWGGSRVMKAASIVAVVCVLFAALSQTAQAESIFRRLARWTDSVFELFAPGEEREIAQYEFKTDNPGLQQVYDTLTELGVTEPVVPMWLPEGYELRECKVMDTRNKIEVFATFTNGDEKLAYKANIYHSNTNITYYKDEQDIDTVEIGGINHNIMQNNELWVVVWTRDNIECSISVSCQEDVFNTILESIYSVEVE